MKKTLGGLYFINSIDEAFVASTDSFSVYY